MANTASDLPRTARGAATRARIVSAAANLMRTRGVANTSLDAVLEASDTSKSQLYHYFADKDALVLAVVERQTDRVVGTHQPLLERVSSVAGLREWRSAIVALTARENYAGCPLGSLVTELAASAGSRAALAKGFAEWKSELHAALERITSTRSKPRADLDELATLLLTALQGGLLLTHTAHTTRPLEIALDSAIDQIEARLTSTQSDTSAAASARRR